MSKEKTRFGLLGLCVTGAFALMAFVASAAQAAPPEWMRNGVNVFSNTAITARLSSDSLIIMLSKTLSTTIEIDCTEQELTTATLEAGGKATVTVDFKNCTTKLGKVNSAVCKPKEPISSVAVLQIALHQGVPVIRATNPNGPLAEFEFNAPCTVASPKALTGTGWIADCLNRAETEEPAHLIIESTSAASALGGLFFGKEPASIDGSIIVENVKVGTTAQNFSILAG